MKQFLLFFPALLFSALLGAQNGRSIKVDIKPFKGKMVYLGYYFGKGQYVMDSVILDQEGKGVFPGKDKLHKGIYFVVFPGKRNFNEFLVDRGQDFTIVITDTIDVMKHINFINSPENDRYKAYQAFVGEAGIKLAGLDARLSSSRSRADSADIETQLIAERKKVIDWRNDFKKKNPEDILTAFFKALDEPEVPPADKHPGGKYDTTFAYYYYKNHYWDGVSFSDEALVRTPFYEPKIDRYFDKIIVQAPDTVLKEATKMIEAGKSNSETSKFLLDKFIRKYVNPTYMGQDVVFVRLYEKYFLGGQEYDWVNEKYKKFLQDRYYSLVPNIVGEKAYDIALTDTLGTVKDVYGIDAKYLVVCFWDPTCGHCQKEVPKLDSLFQNKWKKMGIKLLGVMVDGGKEAWVKYIREHNLKDWIHLYQTDAQHEVEKNSGKPGYKQLYDVFQTPILYLLDKEKRIVAKRINYEQLNEIIDRSEKNPKG